LISFRTWVAELGLGFGRYGLRILALEGMEVVIVLGAMKRDDGEEEKDCMIMSGMWLMNRRLMVHGLTLEIMKTMGSFGHTSGLLAFWNRLE